MNGLGCHRTEAQWSFDYLYDHSHQQEVSRETVTTENPTKEILRLHARCQETGGSSSQGDGAIAASSVS